MKLRRIRRTLSIILLAAILSALAGCRIFPELPARLGLTPPPCPAVCVCKPCECGIQK